MVARQFPEGECAPILQGGEPAIKYLTCLGMAHKKYAIQCQQVVQGGYCPPLISPVKIYKEITAEYNVVGPINRKRPRVQQIAVIEIDHFADLLRQFVIFVFLDEVLVAEIHFISTKGIFTICTASGARNRIGTDIHGIYLITGGGITKIAKRHGQRIRLLTCRARNT